MNRLAFTLIVGFTVAPLVLQAAEPDPAEHVYRWRSSQDKTHVLWVGGGHWHDTLQTASILRRVLESSGRFHVTYSEDTATLRQPDRYDAILLNGMIDSFSPGAEQALIESVDQGKPLFVLHAASACFRPPPPVQWEALAKQHKEFFRMIGGYVLKHDPFGPFQVRIVDPEHPIVASVTPFMIEDELFEFREFQQDNHVLLAAESGNQVRPIAWTRKAGSGRVFHLSLGHNEKAAENPMFQSLVVNGLDWLVQSGASNEK